MAEHNKNVINVYYSIFMYYLLVLLNINDKLFLFLNRVAEGETLGIIAAKYKTTVEDILTLNKVKGYFHCKDNQQDS